MVTGLRKGPNNPAGPAELRRMFLRWAALHGAAVQGFWLVTSVYLVVDVGLSPLQLLLLGTALEVAILIAEVPTGVLADTVSRKWSMVISMALTSGAFALTAVSGSFGPLVAAKILWGIGFTFVSGADVAWITDELAHRGADDVAVDRAVAGKGAWRQRGGAAGLIVFGLVAWATTLAISMLAAAVLVAGLAVLVAVQFPEDGFSRQPDRSVRERAGDAGAILRTGATLIRSDRAVMGLLAATLLFNLGAEAMDRLTEFRLVELGLPAGVDPVVFFTGLGIVGLLCGAALLLALQSRFQQDVGVRTVYGSMALLAAAGAVVVTVAPNAVIGAAGVFLARGLAWSVLPVVGSLWINRSTTSATRATVQSVLGQVTSLGQILGGLLLGLVAATINLPAALALSGVLFAVSGLMILAPGRRRPVTVANS